MENLKLWN